MPDTDTGTAEPPEVTDLTAAIQRAWDKEFSRPFSDGIDYRQARVAAETVLGLLAKPAAHDPMTDCNCEPNSAGVTCEFRMLADAVGGAFNPRDDEMAEVAILIGAVERAAKFIGEQPCACTPEMIEDWDQCPRCAALGQRDGKAVRR